MLLNFTQKRLLSWFPLMQFVGLLLCLLQCSEKKAHALTLCTMIDRISFTTFEVPESDFLDFCFIVEELLREKIPGLDIPDARTVGKDVRVLVGAPRREMNNFSLRQSATLRDILTSIASVWGVAIVIQSNNVVFVEVVDVERFKEGVLILPN